MVISFTNDATNNLKNNLVNKYNIEIDIYTFHKLSLKILKDNNYPYNIAIDNLLDITIDNFFECILPNNPKLKKAINIILGKKYTSKELNNLKRLIKTFISLFKSNNHNFTHYLTILKKIKYTFNLKEYITNKYILLIIINIHLLYIDELSKDNMLDFDDMINKCSELINDNCMLPNWKYIIIDEYQDTSLTKLKFIKKIIEKTNGKFLAVGDDFQSIYRFTGCDLNLFLNFDKYFEYSKIFKIVNTYRNPQELINMAGSFIMKNPKQQKKKLLSSKHIEHPIIIYETNNYIKTLKYLINLINNNIMILSRNNNDIKKYIDDEYKQLDKNTYIYNNISFKYLTIHRSKGLEENNIIIINTEDNITSIPTKIKNDKLLKYVNKEKDYYPYEEERRLFYVALTRTKNRVYIITPEHNKSIFINELLKNKTIKKINYK